MSMSCTTLVTFLVQTPRFARRVDLFGSWDNFSKAYPMERDQRMGSRQWRGCHSFTDIICDGDASQVTHCRDGGLMMGGVYWYYYQINNDVEYYNPAEPCTTTCPYLPGKEVNILEVPMQINVLDETDQRRLSSPISPTGFTLNPNDKYITPTPPKEKSSGRCSSSIAYTGASTTTPRTDVQNTVSNDEWNCQQTQTPAECSFPSLWNAVQLRHSDPFPIRSEPCTRPPSRWAMCSGERELHSAAAGHSNDQLHMKQSNATICRIPSQSYQPEVTRFLSDFGTKTFTQSTFMDTDSLTASNDSRVEYPTMFDTKSYGTAGACKFPSPFAESSMSGTEGLVDSVSSNQVMDANKLCTPMNELQFGFLASTFDHGSQTADTVIPQPTDPISITAFVSKGNPGNAEATNDISLSQSPGSFGQTFDDSNQKIDKIPISLPSSYGQSHVPSPALSSSALPGSTSPYHSSQPETPTMSDFEDNAYGLHYAAMPSQGLKSASNKHDHAFSLHPKPKGDGSFDGYSLCEEHHASALAVKSLPPTHVTSPDSESAYDRKSGKEFVESWNGGAELRKSITEDLFDDLGYLGGMII